MHLLRSASGNIRDKIQKLFGDTLEKRDQDALAHLIYDPDLVLKSLKTEDKISKDYLTITIHRLINLLKFVYFSNLIGIFSVLIDYDWVFDFYPVFGIFYKFY